MSNFQYLVQDLFCHMTEKNCEILPSTGVLLSPFISNQFDLFGKLSSNFETLLNCLETDDFTFPLLISN